MPIALSGGNSDKFATGQSSLSFIQSTSPLPSRLTLPALAAHNAPTDSMTDTCNGALSNSVVRGFQPGSSHFLKSRRTPNLGSFNMRTLMQVDHRMFSSDSELTFDCRLLRPWNLNPGPE